MVLPRYKTVIFVHGNLP
nr:hypothetical protein [Spirosoma utsteinense]